MEAPIKKEREEVYKKNLSSYWFTTGQVSTPFLSFMNGFNPPRAHVFSLQHYKKLKTCDKI